MLKCKWRALLLNLTVASGFLRSHTNPFGFQCRYLSKVARFVDIMGRKSRGNPYSEADYVVADGMRSVIPYVHNFTTFAKARWIGREIIDVLTREFGGHPVEYWKNAIKFGHVRINGQSVSETYRFKNSDAMLHRTHRHEPTVAGEILFRHSAVLCRLTQRTAQLPPTVMPADPYYRRNLQN
jgi:hypothetical protein